MSVPIPRFLSNVNEAREAGYDVVCADCGAGMHDDSDSHDLFCPQHPDIEENRAPWHQKEIER